MLINLQNYNEDFITTNLVQPVNIRTVIQRNFKKEKLQCIPNIFSVNFHWTFLQYQVKIHNEIHNKIQSKKISMRGNFYSKSADVQFRITIQQTKIKKKSL